MAMAMAAEFKLLSTAASLRDICMKINPPGREQQVSRSGNFIPCLLPQNNFDEILPQLLLGDQFLGVDPKRCVEKGVTHVLNAAQGSKFGNVNTNESMFIPFNIKFMGVPAQDTMGFNLSAYFTSATQFIANALEDSNSKVYIHCVQGISRSTTLLCAFLMMERHLTAEDALTIVRRKREVLPNEGFRKQLCQLESELRQKEQEAEEK